MDRYDADQFRDRYVRPKRKAASTGEDGTRWWCQAQHEGWSPLPIPEACPKCGAGISYTQARRSGQVPKALIDAWRKRDAAR